MATMSYTEARKSLKQVMDRVIDDHEEVVITRRNGDAVVVVGAEEWSAIQETLYLTSTPINAKALMTSINELDRGLGLEKDIDIS